MSARARLAFALTLVVGVRSAGADPPDLQAVVDKQSARISELEATLAAMQQRLAVIEQRVGLAALDSTFVRPLAAQGLRLDLQGTVTVESRGAGPKKKSLAAHIGSFEGAVVALWATWCVPCTTDVELEHLRTLREQLHRQRFELITLAVDDLAKVQGDPRAEKWLYPLWHRTDAHLALPKELIQTIGVGLPLFLVVSKTGELRSYGNRALDSAAVRDLVSATATVCRR